MAIQNTWPYFEHLYIGTAVVGISSNLFCFWHFISIKSKSIPNRLMTLLKTTDSAIIIMGTVFAVFITRGFVSTVPHSFYAIFGAFLVYSSMVTVSLAVTRAIALPRPFYVIRSNMLYSSIAVIAVFVIIGNLVIYFALCQNKLEIKNIASGVLAQLLGLSVVLAASSSVYLLYRLNKNAALEERNTENHTTSVYQIKGGKTQEMRQLQ